MSRNAPLAGFTATPAYRSRALGGELSNFGCYAVDVLISLVHTPVASVFALTSQYFYPDYVAAGMEDLGQISLQFQNGVIWTVLAARLPGQQDNLVNLKVTCERGALRATDFADSIGLDGVSRTEIRVENDAPHDGARLCGMCAN